MRPLIAAPLAVGAAGLACVAYGTLYEINAFVVREVSVPVLKPGSRPVRILHLSDTHMIPHQKRKQAWLRTLARWDPDLVVNTGDNFAHLDSLPNIVESYGDLLDRPGVFVFGSNDYFSPSFGNPLRYLRGGTGLRDDSAVSLQKSKWNRPRDLPFEQLRAEFIRRGWVDLNNRHDDLMIDGQRFAFVGVDDPHLGFDNLTDHGPDADATLSIAVAHAPYLRVLDHWNQLGFPLIMAGHTHGGQLRIPFYGSLVTNCDLDPARARGLHHHATPGSDPSWLHVSGGIGTSPFAPIRFACRPEATLLTLTS